MKLARQLIGHLAEKRFDPNEFVDEHRARVEAEIKKKVAGKEISIEEEAPAKAPRSNVINLMDALKASLAKPGAAKPLSKVSKGAASKRAKKSA